MKILVVGFDHLISKLTKSYEPFLKHGFEPIYYKLSQSEDYLSHSLLNRLKNRIIQTTLFKLILSLVFIKKPDVHHVEVYFDSSLAALLVTLTCRLRGIPVIAVCRGTEIRCIESHRWLRKASIVNTLKLCNSILAKERYMPSKIESFGILKNKIRSINNVLPVDFEYQRSLFNPDVQEIIYINSVREMRYVKETVAAFYKASMDHPKARLTIVGVANDGGFSPERTYENEIRDYIILNNMQSRVTLKPFSNNPWENIVASAFVLHADVIWLNNSLLEAAGYGIPLILSDVDGAEVFEKGALITPLGNVEKLSNAMVSVFSNPENLNEYSMSLSQIVHNQFKFETFECSQLSFYNALGKQGDS